MAKELRAAHGDKVLGNVTVEQVFGGMRGVKAMLWEPSVLDSEEGIRFWGRTIPECQEVLPTAPGGKEMLPEAMFWYLLTGKVPSEAESKQFQEQLVARSDLPKHVETVLDACREFSFFFVVSLFLNTHNASLSMSSQDSSPYDSIHHRCRRSQPRLSVRRQVQVWYEEG